MKSGSRTDPGSSPVMLNTTTIDDPKLFGFEAFPNTLEPYVAAVVFETLIYGIYFVLFSMCLYILIRRRHTVHWILPFLVIVMFALSTADCYYTIHLLFHRLLKGDLKFKNLKPKYWLYISNNILADATLLYRCYVVWAGNLRILALPGLLLITSIFCGYVFEGAKTDSPLFAYAWIYLILTFGLNVILTGLIAGRIWWLSWKGKKILDKNHRHYYYVAVAATLESGLLMAVYMLADLIFVNIILDAGLIQVVGIVPTVIIVQVGLGRAVRLVEEDVEETLEPIAVAQLTASQEVVSNQNHVLSFYSDEQITVHPKGDGCSHQLSSGSIPCYQDQLRFGEHRITIDENGGEKSSQHDVKQQPSESETQCDAEKGLQRGVQVTLSEPDERNEAPGP